MSSHNLTPASPFHQRFLGWMNEHFPAANSIVVLILFLVCSAVVQFANGAESYALCVKDAFAAVAAWSVFFLLRILDEHKDYALDVKNHPQ